jgi:predicted ATPase/class 3 adenylate cyclase/Tfp pilus assembly protein PilF
LPCTIPFVVLEPDVVGLQQLLARHGFDGIALVVEAEQHRTAAHPFDEPQVADDTGERDGAAPVDRRSRPHRSFATSQTSSIAVHALLITDLVDSTRLAESLGDVRMAAASAAHDRAARELLAAWNGREIDKSDGMLLLFERAADAVGFALAFHSALVDLHLPLQARAGIHFGEVALSANPSEAVARGAKPLEVRGISVARAARIMAVAQGGQTLLSAEALGESGADPELVRSHGHWMLKGIAEPVELFEVIAPGGTFQAPSDAAKAYRVVRRADGWTPVRDIAHSLPAERNEFVGREAALHDLVRILDRGTRLISIVGIGGTGKTRIAVRFARSCLGEFSGGGWFCDLSNARSLDGVHFGVAQGLGVQLRAADPTRQIAEAIAARGDCLVVLDNFEQVAQLAEPTLGQWLDRAPLARFIVTTRIVLGLAGETVFDLPPLNDAEAAQLLMLRARAAQRAFAPEAADRDAVAALARRLDGLPLAIELAAARMRVIPPRQLLQRVGRRFELLSSRGGRPDRQATLRATLDWSWDLLDDAERAALAQLAVFRGSFDLAAAEAVLALPADKPAVDVLGSLIDKSLVRALEGDRFGMLETVRDYAALQLAALPATTADPVGLRERHWHHFAGLDERTAVSARCADLENLVAACRTASAAPAPAAAVRCLVNAWAALRLTGPFRAAVDLAGDVAVLPGLGGPDAALVHWVRGAALDMMGESDAARAQFRQGLDRIDAIVPSEAGIRLRLALGSQLTFEADPAEAQAQLEHAERDAAALGEEPLRATALNMLGRLMDHQARVDEARRRYLQALDIARATGDRHLEGGLLGNLGGLHYDLGELDAARTHYESSLAIAEEVGDRLYQGNACSNLGLLLLDQGRPDEARTRLEQAQALARGAGNARLEYTVACNLGILLAGQGQLPEAERHFAGAVTAAMRAADRRAEGQFRGHLAVALARQGRLTEAREAVERGEYALGALADRLSLALLGCDRAEVEWLAGEANAARQSHALAAATADELACGDDSELRRRLQRVAALFAG